MTTTPPLPVSDTLPPHPTTTLKWPRVIGIISIIFGAFGLMQAISILFTPLINKVQLQSMGESAADARLQAVMEASNRLAWIQAPVALILGGILLFAGIQLLKRKKIGKISHLAWATLKLTLGGVLLYFSSINQMEAFQAGVSLGAGESGDNQEAVDKIGEFGSIAMKAGMVIAYLWLAAYPVFLFIWFNRSKVKHDLEQEFS